MVSEEYFKKLEARCAKYYYLYQPDAIRDCVALAREIAKYTSNEGMITKIVNSLKRMGVLNIEGLMEADIDEIAKIKNMGHESLNIIRTIKGLPTLTYAQAHPYIGTSDEIIKKIESLGYVYEKKLWADGSVMTHKFKRYDACIKDAYWEVSIEDHRDEGDCDDYLIYSLYHDPDRKDWEGHQIDEHGAVEFEVMKLIVKFINILEKEET